MHSFVWIPLQGVDHSFGNYIEIDRVSCELQRPWQSTYRPVSKYDHVFAVSVSVKRPLRLSLLKRKVHSCCTFIPIIPKANIPEASNTQSQKKSVGRREKFLSKDLI